MTARSPLSRRSPNATASAAAALLAGLLLPGCVIVPATIETYDAGCQTVSRHMVLESVQIAAINRCSNQGCTMLVVAAAATVAASAIVSGSIVVVGNAAYWIEKRATCREPVIIAPVVVQNIPPAPTPD